MYGSYDSGHLPVDVELLYIKQQDLIQVCLAACTVREECIWRLEKGRGYLVLRNSEKWKQPHYAKIRGGDSALYSK